MCSCSLFFAAAHFHLGGRQHFSVSHHPYNIVTFFFRRNNWSPLFFISRFSSFPVIHVNLDSCKLFHKEKTFFKERRWPTISRQTEVSCPRKRSPPKKCSASKHITLPTLVGLTPDYLSPPPKFVRTYGRTVTSQPNLLASIGSHFLFRYGPGASASGNAAITPSNLNTCLLSLSATAPMQDDHTKTPHVLASQK